MLDEGTGLQNTPASPVPLFLVPSAREGRNLRRGGTCTLLPRRARGDADFGPDGGREGQGRRVGMPLQRVLRFYLYNYGGLGASRSEIEED